MTLNEKVNLRFEQDDGVVWVFDGDSQFGTEISHLMMMHADEYKEDELRVICNHAACEIDRLRAELEKAKAHAVPDTHVIVPKEPNDEIIASMKLTWRESDCAHIMKTSVAKSIYEGILKASESGDEG
nr:MAG TPA: hypothetical protein [Caudoviricetes sp.]